MLPFPTQTSSSPDTGIMLSPITDRRWSYLSKWMILTISSIMCLNLAVLICASLYARHLRHTHNRSHPPPNIA